MRTWLWRTGMVPVRLPANFSLKSARPGKAQRAAEADHGRLADVGQLRDLGDRLGQHLARMLEHQGRDALLGRRQFVLQVLHALHQRIGAAAAAQVLGQDARHAVQAGFGVMIT
jgi:hypothetical protein